MTHTNSSESLTELLNESQQPNNTSLAWEYEIGDFVLGTSTSQIPRLPNLEKEEEVQPTTELNEEGKTVDQLELLSDSNCIIAPSQPSAGGKRRIKRQLRRSTRLNKAHLVSDSNVSVIPDTQHLTQVKKE